MIKNKKVFDSFGYILLLFSITYILYNYGTYVLLETSYLINGSNNFSKYTNKEKVGEKFIYEFSDDQNKVYKSLATEKNFQQEEEIHVRQVPFLSTVIFGKFQLFGYLINSELQYE